MDGRFDSAGAHFRAAIGELQADTGSHELAIADIESDLAVLLKNEQKYDSAGPLYRDVIDLRRRYLGEDHSQYAQALSNYGVFMLATGNTAAAESLAVLALDSYRRSIGEAHPEYAAALNSVAVSKLRRGDCPDAIPLFRQAADTYEQALGEGYWVPSAIRINLGRCLTATRQYPEAERVLLTSNAKLSKIFGDTASTARAARSRLVELYEAWGKPAPGGGLPPARRQHQPALGPARHRPPGADDQFERTRAP